MISLCRYLILTTFLSLFAVAGVADTENTQQANPIITMETSMGVIQLELYPEKAPITVANFLEYVNEGFYDGTIFHRVIPYFMIQGGGMGKDLELKPNRDAIVSEADNGLNNDRGTIAMARTQDVNSAKSQFFINVEDNRHLNFSRRSGGYTVFGKVIKGIEVVDEISNVETGNFEQHYDLPIEPIILYSISTKLPSTNL